MNVFEFVYRAFKKIRFLLYKIVTKILGRILFSLNGVEYQNGLTVNGLLELTVTRNGKFAVGENLKINSGSKFNPIGRQQRTLLWVGGSLLIGDNVGMSSTAIVCHHRISIGNNVKIGGNVVVYDTDFHALDLDLRRSVDTDSINAGSSPVTICDDVFIGAHSTILKGVTIGAGAVIGACSVFSKDIPPLEVWAGNPARLVRRL